jgi:hypothetical protein
MNGPTKKPKLGLALEPLEVAIFFAGLVVVFGLYLESGADWAKAAKSHVWPARPVTGTALVALGVFAEVAIGLFIARSAKRAQLEAEERISLAERATAEANERTANLHVEVDNAQERIAELQERTAKAEKDAAEANLARVRLEKKFKVRTIADVAYSDLQEALGSYIGTRIDVFAFGYSQLSEVMPFAFELTTACRRAGCNCKLWEPEPSMKPPLITTGSVLMTTAREATPEQNDIFLPLANVFASTFFKSGIKFEFDVQRFSDTDPIAPNPAPTFLPWNPNDVARFRIQIIELSLLDSRFAPS